MQETQEMKKYFVYLDDETDVYRIAVPAVSEEAAREYVAGNGEVVAVKEVTNDFNMSAESVAKALKNDGWAEAEVDFVTRALSQMKVVE